MTIVIRHLLMLLCVGTIVSRINGQTSIPLVRPQTEPIHSVKPDWKFYVVQYLAHNRENAGLRHFVAAVDSVSTTPLTDEDFDSLKAVIAGGWSFATPGAKAVLAKNRTAIGEGFMAGSAFVEMPPVEDYTTPSWAGEGKRSHGAQVFRLLRLMCVTARETEASGDLLLAAEQALATARLSQSICGPGSPPVAYTIGITGIRFAMQALTGILQNATLNSDIAERIFKSCAALDSGHPSLARVVREEGRRHIVSLEKVRLDRAVVQYMDDVSTKALLVESGYPIKWWTEELERVYGTIASNCEQPFWKQTRMTKSYLDTLSTNPLFQVWHLDYETLAIRGDVARASVRLCQILAALRAGSATPHLEDPFTGQRLHVNKEAVHSVGPDGKDDLAKVIYDPTNGTVSPGDIVIRRMSGHRD